MLLGSESRRPGKPKKMLATWGLILAQPARRSQLLLCLPLPLHLPHYLPIFSHRHMRRRKPEVCMAQGGSSVSAGWKFLRCKLKHLFRVMNTGTQALDLVKLSSLPLSFHFLPLKVSPGNSPALVWVFGPVILETFSIYPTIKTLQLHAVFLKRKLDAIRSFEDGLACRLHNIKKNHVGKWRGLFEELWRKATNELYTGFSPSSQRVNTICGKGKNLLWY